MSEDYDYIENNADNRRFGYIITFVLTILAVAVAIHFLSGCKSEKCIARKALTNMDKTNRKYEDKSEFDTVKYHWCNINAPMKVGQGKTVYLPGKKVVKYDTISTVQVVPHTDTILKTVTITKYVHTVDTVQVRDTVINTSEVKLLQAQISGLNAQIGKSADRERNAIERSNMWRNRAFQAVGGLLFLILAIVVYGYMKFRSAYGRK